MTIDEGHDRAMKLFGYFRSSAAFRVRIALNLKGIAHERGFLKFRDGEQHGESFRQLNPQGLVPVLIDGGAALTQSLAILEYLEATYPQPPLLPAEEIDKAYVRSLALAVACDLHPLNNLRVLRYLEYNLGLDDDRRNRWYRHWIREEFTALETKLAGDGRHGEFCFGDAPTIADVCLVPQMFNARRFECDLADYPTLRMIDENCRKLQPFVDAAPENQPDAE